MHEHVSSQQQVVHKFFSKTSYFPGKRQKLDSFVSTILQKYNKKILHFMAGWPGLTRLFASKPRADGGSSLQHFVQSCPDVTDPSVADFLLLLFILNWFNVSLISCIYTGKVEDVSKT